MMRTSTTFYQRSLDKKNIRRTIQGHLRRALVAMQKLLEKFPTSPMLLSDLQQVKSNLKEKQNVRALYFYQRNTTS